MSQRRASPFLSLLSLLSLLSSQTELTSSIFRRVPVLVTLAYLLVWYRKRSKWDVEETAPILEKGGNDSERVSSKEMEV